MQARITELRSCSGERHAGQLAARAPHGRGVAGRPRRPSENVTGPQTTNMSATPGKSRNHTKACVMQTVTHPVQRTACKTVFQREQVKIRSVAIQTTGCDKLRCHPASPWASPRLQAGDLSRGRVFGRRGHHTPGAATTSL